MASMVFGTGLGAGTSGLLSKLELEPFTEVALAFFTALEAGVFVAVAFFTATAFAGVAFLAVVVNFLAVKLATVTADTG